MLSLKRDTLLVLLSLVLSSCGNEQSRKIEDQETWFYDHVAELSGITENIQDSQLDWVPGYSKDISGYSKEDHALYNKIKLIVEENGAKSARIVRSCSADNSQCWVTGLFIRTRVGHEKVTTIHDLWYVLPDHAKEEASLLKTMNCKELNVPNWYSCVFNRD